MNVSVVIHTQNEEKNIEGCIESAWLLTDKIVAIDMESNDHTIEIVKTLEVPVFNFPKSNYVEPAREFGIKKSGADWVFILDADERITKELADEIKKHMPNFVCSFKPDERQKIADSWPESVDDSEARKDWGWKPSYLLPEMAAEMLLKLREKLTVEVLI